MWHPSNFFSTLPLLPSHLPLTIDIQSSIDSLSDKFTQLQNNHQSKNSHFPWNFSYILSSLPVDLSNILSPITFFLLYSCTFIDHIYVALLLKCQHDYSKAVSQGTSSDSSFQIHINNEKEVINSGLDQLAHLGKQYNRETTTLKDFIAQDYNNVKASSSANLKDTTNPIDSLKTFVESNFESIKAKVFFLDGM